LLRLQPDQTEPASSLIEDLVPLMKPATSRDQVAVPAHDRRNRRARQPLDPTALVRLEQAAAKGADRRAAELARAHNRRTVLLAVLTMIATFLVAGAGGFWWGHSAQTAAITSTEAGVSAAFRDGPAAASGWLNLMRANDGNLVREACTASTVKTADGGRACEVGLWVDPPTNPTPRTEPIRR
jgi:hypothetical protein